MQRKSLWGSYKAIPPKTRITLGLAGMVFATAGMYFADYVEQKKPATELEKQQLEMISPIVIVDRPSK